VFSDVTGLNVGDDVASAATIDGQTPAPTRRRRRATNLGIFESMLMPRWVLFNRSSVSGVSAGESCATLRTGAES